MPTEVSEPTGLVVTVNVALVAPAGTVTLDGTAATADAALDSATAAPPLGAGALSVTVPVEVPPPVTLDGFSVSDDSVMTGGVTVREAVALAPLYDAEIATDVDEATWLVLTVKVAVVVPPATVTLDGTLATPGFALDRETRAPPLGAGALSVTVPVDGVPPDTLDGMRVRVSCSTGWPAARLRRTVTLLEL